jgi:hypothetical protein
VRAALEWAFSDEGDITVGVELAATVAPLFIGLSLLEECARWCERALAGLDAPARGTRQEMILQEALALSSMYTSGKSDQVRAAIERGLALSSTTSCATTGGSQRSENGQRATSSAKA